MSVNVAPELLEQLDRAKDLPVQVVVRLQSPDEPAARISPEQIAALADSLIERVTADVGHPPARSNVLRNLGTVVLEADPQFVRALLKQPEIASAIPNKPAESPFIPPRRKRPVK